MINLKRLLSKLFNLEFYVSKLDEFLLRFRKEHPKLSESQRKERAKYDRIFKLRDDPQSEQTDNKKLWSQF